MLVNMSKRDIAIFFISLGMLFGMCTSVFSGYTLDINRSQQLINQSCTTSKPKKYEVYFFGKMVNITCENGEAHHYNLLTLDGNSTH